MISRLWPLLFLFAVWCGFSNNFHLANLLLGLFFATAVHFLVIRKMSLKINIVEFFIVLFYMIWELFRSSAQVAYDILKFHEKDQSMFVEVPLKCRHPAQISLLTNLISLTPGTLTIDLSENKKSIMLHIMFDYEKDNIVSFVKDKLEPKVIKLLTYD